MKGGNSKQEKVQGEQKKQEQRKPWQKNISINVLKPEEGSRRNSYHEVWSQQQLSKDQGGAIKSHTKELW